MLLIQKYPCFFSVAFVVGVASAVAFQPMAALEMHGLLAELESLP